MSLGENPRPKPRFDEQFKKLQISSMEKQELPSWRDCCIYRVPKTLRKIKPEAYTPRLISLGPLKTPLQERTDEPPVQDETVKMETVKLKYLEKFYERTERNLEELLKIVEKEEERIRRCYEEIDVKGDVFRKRILVDSVFIIELFLKEKQPKKHVDDFIVGKPWLRTAVQEDLILLENQLPYFILDELYKYAFANASPQYPTFQELVELYFENYLRPTNGNYETLSCDCCSWFYCFWLNKCRWCQNSSNQNQEETTEYIPRPFPPLHFTDLIRWQLLQKHPHPYSENTQNENQQSSPQHCIDIISSCCQSRGSKKKVKYVFSATKLNDAGVTFKAPETGWPLDITFKDGVLSMPSLAIQDSTECLFRNLMAFEQCHYPSKAYICNYIRFIDCLIDTDKDVDFLIDKGILVNWLGDSKMVAELFNDLCKEIIEDEFCFETIRQKLYDHYGNCWYRTVAIMKHVYFGNIFRGSGTIVAIMLLIFTLIQSINSLMEIF
ncbi:hypothetical protein GH714_042341 [Hevea brasiliensis]|uniref:Uncharacterized protein n=1 Tax=Hevea brasiliensis TaxID=3981 RepID=A0A6A6KCS8_HEVBR|nr:hypothetical protein GH714_042341 [Hevea brasiliensis]